MSNTIAAGDTVALKSGGPVMTVEKEGPEGWCDVVWYCEQRQEIGRASVKMAVLVRKETKTSEDPTQDRRHVHGPDGRHAARRDDQERDGNAVRRAEGWEREADSIT